MAKQVLLGTTNPAKIKRFTDLLAGCDVACVTPAMLRIGQEPAETGASPLENARIKAAFYSRWCDRVIGNDSGLYLEGLPLDDPRQPGLHVRAPQGVRLDDDEMIAYYAALAHSLGGRVTAFYLDGIAVACGGQVFGFMDEAYARAGAFDLVDIPHVKRHPGWPLDSLSIYRGTGCYFVEQAGAAGEQDNIIEKEYRARLREFLREALGV